MLLTFAPAFEAKRLVEGRKRDSIPAGKKEKEYELKAGKNYLDFFWKS